MGITIEEVRLVLSTNNRSLELKLRPILSFFSAGRCAAKMRERRR
jgi:hypothetical protein